MNVRSETELAVLALALCPAAAACTRLIDALWLSAGMVLVLAVTGLLTSLARPARQHGGAAPAWGVLLVSACGAAVFELLLAAAAPAAAARLGIYVPLLAVTAPSLGRLIGHEPVDRPRVVLLDTAARSVIFVPVLLVVTAFREVLGAGTLTLGRTIVVEPFFHDPARAVGVAGGALICLGYAAGAARLLQARGPGSEGKDETA